MEQRSMMPPKLAIAILMRNERGKFNLHTGIPSEFGHFRSGEARCKMVAHAMEDLARTHLTSRSVGLLSVEIGSIE